jgi:cyclohexyl-isocyanide hydratase
MNFLPELNWDFCALTETVIDNGGLQLGITAVQPDLSTYDLVVIPGAVAEVIEQQLRDQGFLSWLKTAAQAKRIATVCTGSLLLGATGLLDGLTVTTHPQFCEQLRCQCGCQVVEQRVVKANEQIITAGGVTAGIDLGLQLVEDYAGSEARAAIKHVMTIA